MLTRDQCRHVRQLTRDAFLEANGERRKAIRLAKRNIRREPGSIIGLILISVAIRLAIWLILKWIQDKFAIPPNQYMSDELGFAGLTEKEIEVLPAEDDGGDE